MFLKKGSHDFDSGEAFFERWRFQFCGHQIEGLFGDYTRAGSIAGFADFQRDVEEEGFDFAVVRAGQFDEWAAVAASEIGRVDVRCGALQFDALTQQEAHGGEDFAVNGLVGFIVGQLQPNGIA
jgi:hypothetical protein